MAVQTPREGYRPGTPYLVMDDPAAAIDFYRKVFGAVELFRFQHDGRIGHAELQIGDSCIMLSDAWPEYGYRSAKEIGATPVSLMLYVPNVDEVFARAIAAGATERSPIQNQFYGDRTGNLTDPFGHQWTIGTHVKEVPVEDMQRLFRESMAEMGAK